MANALFDAGRAGFLEGSIDWDADTIKDVLVDHGIDTPVPATDDFLDDIAAGARISTSPAYTSKTTTGGTADAADSVHTSVSGATVESIVIYDDTPVSDAAKNLIAFIDVATGLPVTPNGGDITISWDNGSNRIFRL